MSYCYKCGEPISFFRNSSGEVIPVHQGYGCAGSKGSGTKIYTNYGNFEQGGAGKTHCHYCDQEIYFVRHNGGSVWLDSLGHPWPKHLCYYPEDEYSPLFKTKTKTDHDINYQNCVFGVVVQTELDWSDLNANLTNIVFRFFDADSQTETAVTLQTKSQSASYLTGKICLVDYGENLIFPINELEMMFQLVKDKQREQDNLYAEAIALLKTDYAKGYELLTRLAEAKSIKAIRKLIELLEAKNPRSNKDERLTLNYLKLLFELKPSNEVGKRIAHYYRHGIGAPEDQKKANHWYVIAKNYQRMAFLKDELENNHYSDASQVSELLEIYKKLKLDDKYENLILKIQRDYPRLLLDDSGNVLIGAISDDVLYQWLKHLKSLGDVRSLPKLLEMEVDKHGRNAIANLLLRDFLKGRIDLQYSHKNCTIYFYKQSFSFEAPLSTAVMLLQEAYAEEGIKYLLPLLKIYVIYKVQPGNGVKTKTSKLMLKLVDSPELSVFNDQTYFEIANLIDTQLNLPHIANKLYKKRVDNLPLGKVNQQCLFALANNHVISRGCLESFESINAGKQYYLLARDCGFTFNFEMRLQEISQAEEQLRSRIHYLKYVQPEIYKSKAEAKAKAKAKATAQSKPKSKAKTAQ